MTHTLTHYAGARHSKGDMTLGKSVKTKAKEIVGHMEELGFADDEAETMSAGTLLIDFMGCQEFAVATKAGDPYLWMPYGPIYKDGKFRNVTPEFAKTFKLPPFQPPVKLGSHDDNAPAGGHISGFELRDDGIWVHPDYVPNGEKAVTEGHYKYHSPEVIWEGELEDSRTGKLIQGPFIWGDALLHTPHLGESTALYSVKEKTMSEQTMTVPVSLLDRLFGKQAQTPTPEPQTQTATVDKAQAEKYAALELQVAEYKTKFENMQAEQIRAARVAKFSAEVGKTKAEVTGIPELLAALTDEQAELILTRFRALSAQITESLTREVGKTGLETNAGNASQKIDELVKAKMSELKLDYSAALVKVSEQNAELWAEYQSGLFKKG